MQGSTHCDSHRMRAPHGSNVHAKCRIRRVASNALCLDSESARTSRFFGCKVIAVRTPWGSDFDVARRREVVSPRAPDRRHTPWPPGSCRWAATASGRACGKSSASPGVPRGVDVVSAQRHRHRRRTPVRHRSRDAGVLGVRGRRQAGHHVLQSPASSPWRSRSFWTAAPAWRRSSACCKPRRRTSSVALKPNDLAQIVDFDSRVEIRQGFTGNQAELESAIRHTAAGGSTSLYNAIYIALRELRKIKAVSEEEVRRQALRLVLIAAVLLAASCSRRSPLPYGGAAMPSPNGCYVLVSDKEGLAGRAGST